MEDQKEKLKQHFAKRVTRQARVVLDAFQKFQQSEWEDTQWLAEINEGASKLEKFAQRFEMETHAGIARELVQATANTESGFNAAVLTDIVQRLGLQFQRKSDSSENETTRTYLRTPVYLALQDEVQTTRIIQQLDFFGFRALAFTTAEELIEATTHNKPETIVIDVNFGGEEQKGIATIEAIQEKHETPIPILFTCEDHGDISTRLRASRCGGEEFFGQTVDPGQLIEKIESYTHASPLDPYRVLVVDDSRAQSRYIENALNKAGMITRVVNDPMQVLVALDDFQPEIVIMDMYMPGCTGMEVARVIRQQDRYHSVPIIYLSAEDDVNKQLHAMSLGGDDFLTKPINPRHLVATIHNRGRRARSLLALMVRDSLTGLYNHTHTLYLLETEMAKARAKGTDMTYAMLDIDYFKKINDSYGHPIGDRVLKSLAMFLKQRLRKSDHIGRYGGEEFAVVFPNTTESDARMIMEEILQRFGELRQPAGDNEFQVTFSCGISCLRDQSAQVLCEEADKALYEAKNSGRNAVRCFRG